VVKVVNQLYELAGAYDMPADEFEKTIAQFNGFVADGSDSEFGKPIIKDATPLSHPPFYSMRLWPKVHYTMGGILINTRAQVLNLDGLPIEGLYAAGEVTGGVHGASRLGCCAIADCLVFGRIAGYEAAKCKTIR